jgi:hypothetical protein
MKATKVLPDGNQKYAEFFSKCAWNREKGRV